jgi:hypothetical protein
MNCLAKFSLIVAIVLFLALPVHAAVVNLTEGSGNARIDFNGTSRNFTGELNIGSINVTEGTEVDGQQFKALDITSGSDKLHVGLIANEGEATLPTLTCYFAVPRDGQLEVSIKSVKTAMLKDIKVVPTPSYRNVDGKEVIESAYSQHN